MLDELTKYVKAIGVKDDHAAQTIAHNVLLDERAKGHEFRKAKLLALNELNPTRKSKIERELLYLDRTYDGGESEMSSLHDVVPYIPDNERTSFLRRSQRSLIDRLTCDCDTRTKEIIETFLSLDKPTVTAVGRELGINHTVVSRCLKRLSENFDEKVFGSLSEYLYA